MPARKSLALADWPTADRSAWTAALRPGAEVFDDAGRAAGWALSTRNAVQYDCGRWLGFIAAEDPDALALDPGARASPDRIARFQRHLAKSVGSIGQHSTIRHLRDAMVAMVPGWERIRADEAVANLERARRPRDRRPDVVMTGRLIALGHELMDATLARPVMTSKDLLAYRDGLMIAMLAQRPLRRRNFVAIEVGRHLIRVGDGYHLVFDASDTKTGQPIETDIPADLVPRLERYLTEIRPCFPSSASHRALWAGLKERGLSGQAVYDLIAARTKAAFGHVVNPHLFRHCAATTIAIKQPSQIGVARDLLGHASINTTNAHYNQARSIEASRLHASIVAEYRTRALSHVPPALATHSHDRGSR